MAGVCVKDQPEVRVVFAGLLVSFAAACMRVSNATSSQSQQQALLGASNMFAAAGLSTSQLEALLRLPWQIMVSLVTTCTT